LLAYCFTSFTAFGVVLVLVGANQHDLATALDLDLARSGLLSSALALGIGIGVVVAGRLFDRLPRRPLFAGSMLLTAAALISVSPEMAFERWLLHLAVIGIGSGGYDALINAAVVQRFGARAARPMTLVHAGATLGAMAGPLLVGAIAAQTHWSDSFRALGALHVVLAGIACIVPFAPPDGHDPNHPLDRSSLRVARAILPFAVIAFAYVGVEAAVIVFAPPYAVGLGLDPDRGRFAISAFWLGLLSGRLGAAAVSRPLDAAALAVAGGVAALAIAAGTAIAAPAPEPLFFGVGAALGCVYPVMIALAGHRVPRAQGTASGLAAGAGAVGGFSVPWLTGAIGDGLGIGVAIGSLALWCALVAGVALRTHSRASVASTGASR
jgi:fucose permease